MREVEVNAVRDDERVGLGAAGEVGPNDILRESSPFGLGVEEPEPGDACEDMVAYFDHFISRRVKAKTNSQGMFSRLCQLKTAAVVLFSMCRRTKC